MLSHIISITWSAKWLHKKHCSALSYNHLLHHEVLCKLWHLDWWALTKVNEIVYMCQFRFLLPPITYIGYNLGFAIEKWLYECLYRYIERKCIKDVFITICCLDLICADKNKSFYIKPQSTSALITRSNIKSRQSQT